jgi:phenylacetate-coenzyme A ligase PaaK-like adenylate-forming protein
MSESIRKKLIFKHNGQTFRDIALKVFRFQFLHNPVYRSFCEALGKDLSNVKETEAIPFLPVSMFRNHKVLSADGYDVVFESSGTSGTQSSKHYVHDSRLYEESFMTGFSVLYGDISQYTLLALLPSYLERSNSSLIYMAEKMIQRTAKQESGFYLDDFEKLHKKLAELKKRNENTILLGVSFGLLDFIQNYGIDFPELIVMETGGMKGRKKEITRAELHGFLKAGFNVPAIHSEYGMTELLSQAYSRGEGRFLCPPWMKVYIRDSLDPLSLRHDSHTGGINIIDLANMYSCSFIATDDLGRVFEDGSFEVSGRFDQSAIRGCNTMIE